MVQPNKRREKDVMKLLVSEYDVTLPNESNLSEFIVNFPGPKESPYEGVSKTSDKLISWLISDVLGSVASSRRSSWQLSVQVPKHRFHEQNIPSQYWWCVSWSHLHLDQDQCVLTLSIRLGRRCTNSKTYSTSFCLSCCCTLIQPTP